MTTGGSAPADPAGASQDAADERYDEAFGDRAQPVEVDGVPGPDWAQESRCSYSSTRPSHSVQCMRSSTATSSCARARPTPLSARTEPASRRWSRSWPAFTNPIAADLSSMAGR